MSTLQIALPTEFAALQPFAKFWAAATAAERAHCRDTSDAGSRAEFYGAVINVLPQALAYLDTKPLSQFDDGEQCLMRLLLSFAHVALAVELHRDEEAKHAQYRPYMRITSAPADQPVA